MPRNMFTCSASELKIIFKNFVVFPTQSIYGVMLYVCRIKRPRNVNFYSVLLCLSQFSRNGTKFCGTDCVVFNFNVAYTLVFRKVHATEFARGDIHSVLSMPNVFTAMETEAVGIHHLSKKSCRVPDIIRK